MSGRRWFLLLVPLGVVVAWLLWRRLQGTDAAARWEEPVWAEHAEARTRAAATPPPSPQAPPVAPEPDDLTRIRGIGPVLQGTLQRQGITTFKQIAQFTPDDIQRVSHELGVFRGRIERDRWVEQARNLHEEKYGERV